MPLFSNKDLKQLIVPLLIEQVLSVSIGMFDVVMISSLGEAAVSGVSLVDMINVLMLNLFAALATGGAVVAAQMLGAHDRDGACDSARQLIFIALILSLASLVPLFLLRHVILRLFFGSIAADVMHNALIYYCFSGGTDNHILWLAFLVYLSLRGILQTLWGQRIFSPRYLKQG